MFRDEIVTPEDLRKAASLLEDAPAEHADDFHRNMRVSRWLVRQAERMSPRTQKTKVRE